MARAAYFFKFMLAAFLPQIDSRRRARIKKSSRAAKTVYHFSFDGRAFLCGSISSRRGGFFCAPSVFFFFRPRRERPQFKSLSASFARIPLTRPRGRFFLRPPRRLPQPARKTQTNDAQKSTRRARSRRRRRRRRRADSRRRNIANRGIFDGVSVFDRRRRTLRTRPRPRRQCPSDRHRRRLQKFFLPRPRRHRKRLAPNQKIRNRTVRPKRRPFDSRSENRLRRHRRRPSQRRAGFRSHRARSCLRR